MTPPHTHTHAYVTASGGAGRTEPLASTCAHRPKQVTGSFKARGAVNKLLSLPPDQLARGLVTCSTGNHALAFVHAARAAGGAPALARALIYLPRTASAGKAEKLRARGAALVLHGDDCLDAEVEARRVAGERGLVYVSPYNDYEASGVRQAARSCGVCVALSRAKCMWLALQDQGCVQMRRHATLLITVVGDARPAQVMAGQGTVAIEILEQLQELEELERRRQQQQGQQQEQHQEEDAPGADLVVYIPVGGGGLIGGMAPVS